MIDWQRYRRGGRVQRAGRLRVPLPGLVLLLLAGLSVTGCAGFLAGDPPQVYALTPKSTFDPNLPLIGDSRQLVVEQPSAAGGLNSNRIAVKPHPLQLDYYAGARWTERAPLMVQSLLLESFENTGKIISVGREALGLRPDYSLRGDLREFQAQYFDRSGQATDVPYVLVQLNAKLIEQPRERIFDARNFESCVRAKGADVPSVIEAFDTALGNVMKDVVEWSLRRISGREQFGALADMPLPEPPPPASACRPN